MREPHMAGPVLLLAASLLVGCMSSSGGTFAKVAEAESGGEEKPSPPPQPETGLEIVSSPAGAEVYLNGRFMGMTPLTLTDLKPGSYRLLLHKEGWHEVLAWVSYDGGPMRYQASLSPVTGLVDIEVNPPTAEVRIGDQVRSTGVFELPVGRYAVRVRAFGYEEWRGEIVVYELEATRLDVELTPAPFRIEGVSLGRSVVNPGNPGALGAIEVTFSVTGPADGEAIVLDPFGREAHRRSLGSFRTWNQRFRWHPPSDAVEGPWLLVLEGRSDDRDDRAEITFDVDRDVLVAPRSTWSGGAGLLYVPSAEVLPPGSWQAGVLIAGTVADEAVRVPVEGSLRIGLPAGFELDLQGGAILASYGVPFGGSVAARLQLAAPRRPVGLGAALEGKVSLHGVAGVGILTTDSFANFSGISLGVPLQLVLGSVSLLAEATIISSAWTPTYGAPAPLADPATWLYWRAGVMVEEGPLMAGASLSQRSQPLSEGLLALGLPLQAGAELHCLLPDTHVVLSAVVAGEFEGPDDWYLMGGAGFSVIY